MNENKLNIKPKGHWCLIKPVAVKTETDSGLAIPESVEKEIKAMGEVLDIGPDVKSVEIGEVVIYGAYAGESVQLVSKHEQKDQVDYILLLEEDILATIG